MKYKYKVFLTVIFINFTVFCICANVNVKAQGYDIGISEDDEFVWEVTYLDLDLFIRTLGYEPNFRVGDQIKVVINSVNPREPYWSVDVSFWDYQTDWSKPGSREIFQIFKAAEVYEDSIFLPIPIEDYLEAVETYFQPEYQVEGTTISKIVQAETNENYLYEKTYNNRGVITTEAVTEYDVPNRLIVKVEGTFVLIPLGFYFIGFIIIAITAVIIILMKGKNLILKNF